VTTQLQFIIIIIIIIIIIVTFPEIATSLMIPAVSYVAEYLFLSPSSTFGVKFSLQLFQQPVFLHFTDYSPFEILDEPNVTWDPVCCNLQNI